MLQIKRNVKLNDLWMGFGVKQQRAQHVSWNLLVFLNELKRDPRGGGRRRGGQLTIVSPPQDREKNHVAKSL